jgi:NAD(P)-dependent dehydrogenase (short-subunit alcohol dehydrogenase family)
VSPATLRFENKTALISGGSRGIGKALAMALARAGASVGLIGRAEGSLGQVAREIGDQGGKALPLVADVSQPEAIRYAVGQAQAAMGGIDILINCAGIQAPMGPFVENDLALWEHAISVNLLGAVRLTHAVLPIMQGKGQGKIINFSGGGATAPRPYFSAYATSKAALVRFTETLAVEVKSDNIQVNAVAPGAVNTQMLDEIIAAGERVGEEYHQALERAQTGGTPLELVCDLVLFLASEASGALTGKLIAAPYDPWRQWQGQGEMLNSTPLYTLRRLDPFTIKPLLQFLD